MATQYIWVRFENTQGLNEILIALLSNIAFDSFEEYDENSCTAYIQKDLFDEQEMKETLDSIPALRELTYEVQELENKNWNEEWEKSFQPIVIANQCAVRAPFHSAFNTIYEIVIEPKMAFGTGHHATTEMVLALMLEMDFNNKNVLDFGTGTGILAILADKMGAKQIDANDIEEPAYYNTIENAALNNCTKINAFWGGAEVLPSKQYEIILANITTNTIKENMNFLNNSLYLGGEILFSGILTEQQNQIKELAQSLDFTLVKALEKNNWVALHYKK